VAEQSTLWVCDRSLGGTGGGVLNPAGRNGYLSLLSVVCCQVEVSKIN
jgi:hypothetical protein